MNRIEKIVWLSIGRPRTTNYFAATLMDGDTRASLMNICVVPELISMLAGSDIVRVPLEGMGLWVSNDILISVLLLSSVIVV